MFRQSWVWSNGSQLEHLRRNREGWKQDSNIELWSPRKATAGTYSSLVQIRRSCPSLFVDASLARVLGLERGVWTGLQPDPQFELNAHCTWRSQGKPSFPLRKQEASREWGSAAELRKNTIQPAAVVHSCDPRTLGG